MLRRVDGITFLPSAAKLRRLCFYTCLSLCSQGGSASVHAGMPPPEKEVPPPGKEAPPGKDAPHREGSTPLPGRRLPLRTERILVSPKIESLQLAILLVCTVTPGPTNFNSNLNFILFATLQKCYHIRISTSSHRSNCNTVLFVHLSYCIVFYILSCLLLELRSKNLITTKNPSHKNAFQ